MEWLFGALSIAGSILCLAVVVGIYVGSLRTSVSDFKEQNHKDHRTMITRLNAHAQKVDDHESRIVRVETKVEERGGGVPLSG